MCNRIRKFEFWSQLFQQLVAKPKQKNHLSLYESHLFTEKNEKLNYVVLEDIFISKIL